MALITRILSTASKISFSNNIRLLSTQKFANITPSFSQITFNSNNWIYRENDRIQAPINKTKIDIPKGFNYIQPLIEPLQNLVIEAPSTVNSDVTIEAARLIVIRRKKMKKHKLRKLRKRMKFEWAKVRQRREMKKEKLFQAELIQQCKEAEAFSAEQYVEDKLNKLNEIVIPRYWKGKRLPEFIIREKMGLPPK
ncbi:unnamed protein product [Brassicogethes aeneus]|uniref:Small ribosomal subunit protein mS38 n=1 Tax=Brassicogethes aeneus TaxID=1431903 RepID=A0A9P0B7J3_BRAAE|nr:unnamed protein product [Brassicogethes aeneus]